MAGLLAGRLTGSYEWCQVETMLGRLSSLAVQRALGLWLRLTVVCARHYVVVHCTSHPVEGAGRGYLIPQEGKHIEKC